METTLQRLTEIVDMIDVQIKEDIKKNRKYGIFMNLCELHAHCKINDKEFDDIELIRMRVNDRIFGNQYEFNTGEQELSRPKHTAKEYNERAADIAKQLRQLLPELHAIYASPIPFGDRNMFPEHYEERIMQLAKA
jgi:hypothetical protein